MAVTVIQTKKNVSFHGFPMNPAQAKSWIIRIRREGHEPTKHTYVCGRHFEEGDFSLPSRDTPATFKKKD